MGDGHFCDVLLEVSRPEEVEWFSSDPLLSRSCLLLFLLVLDLMSLGSSSLSESSMSSVMDTNTSSASSSASVILLVCFGVVDGILVFVCDLFTSLVLCA